MTRNQLRVNCYILICHYLLTAKIGLFYLIFYGVLAALFAVCLWVFFQTLDPRIPTCKLSGSLIGTSPGLYHDKVAWTFMCIHPILKMGPHVFSVSPTLLQIRTLWNLVCNIYDYLWQYRITFMQGSETVINWNFYYHHLHTCSIQYMYWMFKSVHMY
jgi:hypothetical protein